MPNPVLRGGGARELIERETRLRHEAGEPTDPPPRIEQDLEDPLDRTRVAREVGFRSGLSHIRAAIQRHSKPVAALLGVWGSVSWMAAVALSYWTRDHVVSVDRYAIDERERATELEARRRDIEGLRSTVTDLREKVAELRGLERALQQQPIQAPAPKPDVPRAGVPGEKGKR